MLHVTLYSTRIYWICAILRLILEDHSALALLIVDIAIVCLWFSGNKYDSEVAGFC